MAVTYGFYNGEDKLYDAGQVSKLFNGVLLDGIISGIGDLFTCRYLSENNITIGSGFGYFKGFYIYNTESFVYNIPSTILPSGVNQCYIVIELVEIDRVFNIKAIKTNNFDDTNQIPIAIVYRNANGYIKIQNLVGYTGKWREPCDQDYFSDSEIIGPKIIHGSMARYHIKNVYDIIHESMYEFYCSYFDINKYGSKADEFNKMLSDWAYVLHHHDSGPSQYEKLVGLLDNKEDKPIAYPVTLEANSSSKTINYTMPDNKILSIESNSIVSITGVTINTNSIYITYNRLSKNCKIYLLIYENPVTHQIAIDELPQLDYPSGNYIDLGSIRVVYI